jgi:hypothetical protein
LPSRNRAPGTWRDLEIRFVAVPNDFVPPEPGVFVKGTMNALADLGEKMGANSLTWRK